MKIKIEIDENLTEEEIIIRCSRLNDDIAAIQKNVADAVHGRQQLTVTRGDTEYYLTVTEILFFETADSQVAVQTAGQIYYTKLKLYELEQLLPAVFMRVSKSTIINTDKIRSIRKNITGSSEVEFGEGHRMTYVSRSYLKPLLAKMEEKRLRK